MVAACRMSGMLAQEAFDTVGQLFDERLARWDIAISRLPLWGQAVDFEIQRYIQGIMDVVKANLYWRYDLGHSDSVPITNNFPPFSFWSERYFGANAAEARRTRRISVLADPPFVQLSAVERVWNTSKPEVAAQLSSPLQKASTMATLSKDLSSLFGTTYSGTKGYSTSRWRGYKHVLHNPIHWVLFIFFPIQLSWVRKHELSEGNNQA
jgi:hypothetical protein